MNARDRHQFHKDPPAVGTVRFIRQNIGTPTAVKVNFQAHIIMQFKQIENDLTIVAKYLFF